MTVARLLLLMLLLVPAPVRAASPWFSPEPPLITLSTGAAGVFDLQQEIFWTIEYRPAARWFHVGPWALFGTGKNAEFYAAAGVLLDLRLGDRWVLTPSFGGGYYHAEEGLDLGLDMQFRSSIELARRFRNGHRLGLGFAHLSNGSLGDFNPGTETLALAWSIPLPGRRPDAPRITAPGRTPPAASSACPSPPTSHCSRSDSSPAR